MGVPLAAGPINEPAQDREQPGSAMDLVEDDKLPEVFVQVELRFGQLGAVLLRFEIQIDRAELFPQGQGDRRFAGLTRAEEHDSGNLA